MSKNINLLKQKYQKVSLGGSRGPSRHPKTRTRASLLNWKKNAVLHHLAAIIGFKSAWDTLKYAVLTFAEHVKPSILQIKTHFKKQACLPNEGKCIFLIKIALLSLEFCFSGS